MNKVVVVPQNAKVVYAQNAKNKGTFWASVLVKVCACLLKKLYAIMGEVPAKEALDTLTVENAQNKTEKVLPQSTDENAVIDAKTVPVLLVDQQSEKGVEKAKELLNANKKALKTSSKNTTKAKTILRPTVNKEKA